MAMTLTTITPVIRTDYIPGMEKYVWSEEFFSQEMERRKQDEQVGSEYEIKIQTGYSEGVNNGAASTILPTARQAKYLKYKGGIKTIRGRIKLDLGIVDLINNDPSRATDLIADEMDGVQETLKSEVERQALGNAGLTPLCCVASASASGTTVTVTVDSGGGVSSCGTRYCTRFLRIGMIIDILSSAYASVSGTSTEELEIAEILGNDSFTIECASSGAATTLAGLLADGQTIFHDNGYSATGATEFYGAEYLFGPNALTNTIYDKNRTLTANSPLRPVVTYVNSSGLVTYAAPTGTATANWSPVNIHEVMEYLTNTNKASEADMFLFAESGIKTAYIQKKKAEGSYFKEDATVDGWPYKVVECEGRPLLTPRLMASNAIAIIPMNKMVRYVNRKIDFREVPDLWSKVQNYDMVEAYLIGTYEYGCKCFKHAAWIGDLKGHYES